MDTVIPEKIRRRRRRKRIMTVVGCLIAVVVIIMAVSSLMERSIKRGNLTFCTAETGNVEYTLSAHGKVVLAYEEVVVSPVASRILEVYHHEGDIVEAGAPLLRLDIQSAEGEVKRLSDELAVRRNSTTETGLDNRTYLTNLEMQIEAKRMAVDELASQVANERRLDSIGSGTGDRVRQAELTWRTGCIELDQLRKQLANETRSREARLQSSRLQEDIQARTLSEARRILTDAGVKAPRRATLTYINNNIGGSVAPGEKLAMLSDLDNFRVAGELPEGEADKVIPGGEVEIKIGKRKIRGRISSVTPQSSNGMIGFNILLDENTQAGLRAGIRVDLNLICGMKEDVVRIANAPYFHGPGVYRLFVVSNDGNHIEARDVTLGESNFDYVEVLSGLRPGERVVTTDLSDYKNVKSLRLSE